MNVNQDAFEVDGIPCYKNYRGTVCLLPNGELYLHEGILCESSNPVNKESPWHSRKIAKITEEVIYRKLDGVWFELKVRPFIEGVSVWDVALKKGFTLIGNGYGPQLSYQNWAQSFWDKNKHREVYGNSNVYCYEKRQLNSREIKKLNLNQGE